MRHIAPSCFGRRAVARHAGLRTPMHPSRLGIPKRTARCRHSGLGRVKSRARAPVCSCQARVTVCSAARSRSATGRRTCTATRAVRSGSPARRSPVSTPSAPSTASAEPMRKRAAGADRGLLPFGQRRAGHRRPDHATAACVHRRSSRVNHSSETRSPVAEDAAAVVGELGPTASRLRTGHTDGTSSRTSTAAGWSRTGRASEHLQAEVRAVLRCARS